MKFEEPEQPEEPEELPFSIITAVENGYVYDKETNTCTIVLPGEYTISGEIIEGRIVVDVDKNAKRS